MTIDCVRLAILIAFRSLALAAELHEVKSKAHFMER